MAGDDEVKRATALALIPSLEGIVEYPDVAAEILLGLRAIRQDYSAFLGSLSEFRREIDVPLAMVTSVYQYLPDGRPLAWPPNHLEMTRNGAHELQIPLFDAVTLVQQHGVSSAMTEELTVYRPEFHPVVGEALFSFLSEIVAKPFVPEFRESKPA